MFGLPARFYIVYVRRQVRCSLLQDIPPGKEPMATRGLFALKYQPHHLVAGVFRHLREAAEHANTLVGYRSQFGAESRPFPTTALPDHVIEYRWQEAIHSFHAVGIIEITSRTDGRPHQPTTDEREALELVASVEEPNAPVPLLLSHSGRGAVLGGAPLNRNWVHRDEVDWVKPLNETGKASLRAAHRGGNEQEPP